MANGTLVFAVVMISLLLIGWFWLCYHEWTAYQNGRLVTFGFRLRTGQSHPNGEPIYLPPTVPSPTLGGALMYRHWCLKPWAPKIAVVVQFLIFVAMLTALAVDRWAMQFSDGTIFGAISERRDGWSATYTELDMPDQAVFGAIALAWSLISMIVMCVVFHQALALLYGTRNYHEDHYFLARFQVIQVVGDLFSSLGIGGIGYDSENFVGAPGPSSFLVLVCVLASWWLTKYFHAAIEFRPPPTAVRVNVTIVNELGVIPSPSTSTTDGSVAYDPAAVVVEGIVVVEGQPSPPSFPVVYQQPYPPPLRHSSPPIIYQPPPAYSPAYQFLMENSSSELNGNPVPPIVRMSLHKSAAWMTPSMVAVYVLGLYCFLKRNS